MAALAYPPSTPLASEVSTTLPVAAGVAFEVFADAVEVPRWLPIIQTSKVIERTAEGRPARVSFTRKLQRGSLGYTLGYKYDSSIYSVAWETPRESTVVMSGEARFIALSSRACMMLYRLVLDLPAIDSTISDELERHPASLVVAEFREHLRRLC